MAVKKIMQKMSLARAVRSHVVSKMASVTYMFRQVSAL